MKATDPFLIWEDIEMNMKKVVMSSSENNKKHHFGWKWCFLCDTGL